MSSAGASRAGGSGRLEWRKRGRPLGSGAKGKKLATTWSVPRKHDRPLGRRNKKTLAALAATAAVVSSKAATAAAGGSSGAATVPDCQP
jgi:hypothetical protein